MKTRYKFTSIVDATLTLTATYLVDILTVAWKQPVKEEERSSMFGAGCERDTDLPEEPA